MINVLIADDHPLLRRGISESISNTPGFAVVGEASDGGQVLRMLVDIQVDIVILDISMPGQGGMETLKQIKNVYPHINVLILSMHAEGHFAERAFKNGADGYLTKDNAPRDLRQALVRISEGNKYVSEPMAEKMVDQLGSIHRPHRLSRLSDREFEILISIAEGNSITAIASDLSLSVKTISTYRSRLLEKLDMTNNAEITRYAIMHGLIE